MLPPLAKNVFVPSAAWTMLGRVPGPVPAKFEYDASLEKDPIQDYGFYTGSVAADTLGSIPVVSPPPS